MNFIPGSAADFLPDEEIDEYGYAWVKENRPHTIENVGYFEGKEVGAIVLGHDNSPAALERVEETSWPQERAEIRSGGSLTINLMREEIRRQHELYG